MIMLMANINDTWQDITAYTGAYSRADNIRALGMSFDFKLLSNPLDRNAKGRELPIGTKLTLFSDGEQIFSGIVVSYERSSLSEYTYKAYDYGFYLNKSEAIIQFNDISASAAIQKLCGENGIPVGAVADISANVRKIYNGSKISDIIRDLITMGENETGKKYRLEVRENKLFIEEYADLIVDAYYQPAAGSGFNPADVPGSFQSTYSIEEMATRVLIASSCEKNATIRATAEDSEAVTKYGLLTRVEKIDDKNNSQAMNIAKKKLKELNKVKRSFKITLFGDDAVRSGRILVFNQPDINLVGAFLVRNCVHRYDGFNHIMELELEV